MTSKQFKITDFCKINSIKEQECLANNIQQEINQISGNLYILLNKLVEVLKLSSYFIIKHINEDYHKQIRERWGESIFRDNIKTDDITKSEEQNSI